MPTTKFRPCKAWAIVDEKGNLWTTPDGEEAFIFMNKRSAELLVCKKEHIQCVSITAANE
jgi:hypothetical protein